MKYLLDTHVLLWIATEDKKLGERVRQIYLDNSNDIFLSIVSLWEIAIKIGLNKLQIEEELSEFVQRHIVGNNIQLLHVLPDHIYLLSTLPYHHRDPFDRLIVSQCLYERMTLLSKDDVLDKYSVKRLW